MPHPTRRDLLSALGCAGIAVAVGEVSRPAVAAEPATRLPHAKPEVIGLNRHQLQVAYDLLEKWATGPDAAVPGGAILVGRFGKVVPPRFFGRMGPEANALPMRPDAMFLMASITKPVVYLAALRLVEQGRLNLTDPVIR